LTTAIVAAVPLVFLAIGVAAQWKRAVASISGLLGDAWRAYRTLSFVEKTLCWASIAALVVSAIAAALPAVFWDPLAYHLPIVALALHRHTLPFEPGLPQTGFPLLAESAALPAFAIAGDAGAAMVTLGAGVGLALLCGLLAERLMAGSGVLAATLLCSSELWLWLAPSFYVDVPFALFAVAALSLPFLTTEPSEAVPLGWLSGAFAGAAAAIKYPGLAVAFLSVLSLVYVRRGRALMPFVLAFAATAAGWYLRGWSLTGDPLYPFLTALTGHHANGSLVNPQMVQKFYTAAPRYCGTAASPVDGLLLPWRLLTEPGRFCGDPGYGLRLGSVLFLTACIVVARARPIAALVVLLTGFWFVTAQQWRFLVSAVALYTAVVSAAAYWLAPRLRTLVVAILALLSWLAVAAALTPSLIGIASNSLVPAYHYLAGRESASTYLDHRLESYAAAEWLRSNAPDAKVYALDDVRDYYFGTMVTWGNSPYPGGLRLDWGVPTNKRYAGLESSGFRYMVVNANSAFTHRTDANVDWQVLAADEAAHTITRVFSANDVYVYDLKSGR